MKTQNLCNNRLITNCPPVWIHNIVQKSDMLSYKMHVAELHFLNLTPKGTELMFEFEFYLLQPLFINELYYW